MDPLLRSTLLKVALPAGTIAVVLAVARWRRIDWREGLGLRPPRAASALAWVGGWILWMIASEFVIDALGLEQAKPWPAYPALIVALRILAIGMLGPASEEMLMRGLLFERLRGTRVGALGAIAIPAGAWAAMHVGYGASTLVLIFCDGLWLGTARHRTGSLWVPIGMHALGNLASIAQSLS
jgi:CAAX protease family protein